MRIMTKPALSLALVFLGFTMAAAAVNPAMHDAAGSGKVFLPDGRAVIRFDATAPKDASATWALKSPLEPGWHTVELGFGPEQDTRKLIDLEFLDPTGAPILAVNLYHAPSRTGELPVAALGIHLTRTAMAIRWRKNQARNMQSAPLLGLSIKPGRPADGRAFMEAVDAPFRSGRMVVPGELGGGLLRAVSPHPVSLKWTQADGVSFTTPAALETTAFLTADLLELSLIDGRNEALLLERRFETKSPVSAVGLDRPVIPLMGAARQHHTLEITGTNLDPKSVRIADFPGGARMAAVQSWDDGIPQDKRATELLQKWGWRASFFFNHHSPMVGRWKELEDLGMEVGSHSWSHPFYPLQSPQRCRDESVLMRLFLESKVGHPVISFAYPFNYGAAYDARGDYVLRAQREAGYLSGRSTLNGPLTLDCLGEPLAMKPNAHFLAGRDRIEWDWQRAAATPQGVFYIWGHTYEIASEADWAAFEDLLKTYGRNPSTWYASQGDLMVWNLLRDTTKLAVSGDANRLVVRMDHGSLHPWWAARVPLAIRVSGQVSRATADGKALSLSGGEIQFNLPAR
jgi:peptidoglycan/xylan/chitin deacetylase (PgdA/CDA1 family)